MSLIDEYLSLGNNFSNNNADWVQFVTDHLTRIRRNSNWLELDADRHNTMRYRLEDFLKEQYIDTNLTWLILILNQLGSNKEFVNLSRLLIPDMDYMNRLKKQYISISSTFDKARK